MATPKAVGIDDQAAPMRVEGSETACVRSAWCGSSIFEAFHEVEVAVRDAGGFGPDDYGTDL